MRYATKLKMNIPNKMPIANQTHVIVHLLSVDNPIALNFLSAYHISDNNTRRKPDTNLSFAIQFCTFTLQRLVTAPFASSKHTSFAAQW